MMISDIDFKDKKVLVRVDFNVPLNAENQITDDTRITAAIPTLKYILERGGAVILMSHLGRPEKYLKEGKPLPIEKLTLKNVQARLSALLERPVEFCEETVGEKVKGLVSKLSPGSVLLLENTRLMPGETKGDVELARQMSELADIYINDAFGASHREHSSTATVARFFDKSSKAFGFLMEAELENGRKILNNPKKPLVAIIGGAKVSDKILLLNKLSELAEHIIIGGGMAYTFFKATGGSIGKSLVEEDKLDIATDLLSKSADSGFNVYLPKDSVVADAFDANANTQIVPSDQIPDGWMGLDIGPDSIAEFEQIIASAGSILWNGPMGVFEFEKFADGTRSIAKAVASATAHGAYSLIGGGDSVAAIQQLGLADQVSFVSTGGGAMLELLEGKLLPAVAAMG